MRVVKAPDVRRAEILSVAEQLFQTKGYSKTSVNEIVLNAKIAKGTFYHYFNSKPDILDALTLQLVEKMILESQRIADDPHLNAIEKIVAIIAQQNTIVDKKKGIVESMHLPENKELHDRVNVAIVKLLSPTFANIVQQGNHEGLFQVDDPLCTVQFILAGSQFLLGKGIFQWTDEEEQARINAMLILIERAFSAKPSSITQVLQEHLNRQ